VVCQRFEVLHDGGEMELVACTGDAAQAHSLEAVMVFKCAKRISIFLRWLLDSSTPVFHGAHALDRGRPR